MASPSTISGLIGWWKASAITTLADGDPVATWPDAGTVGALTQATSGRRPVWRASSLNGKPGVEFIGDDAMAAAMSALSQPGTLIVIAKVTGSTTATFFFTDGGDSSNRWVIGSNLDTASNQIGVYAGGTGLIDKYATDNTAHVFTAVVNGASSTFRRDGAAGSTGNPGAMAFTGPTVGARFNQGSTFLTGVVYDILLFNRVLTTGEQATVHSYGQDEYAIPASDYVSSSTPVTVAVPAATATASAPVPVVTARRAVTVAVPAATATAAAPAPSVTALRQATVTVPPATATASAPAPSVVALRQALVTVPAATALASAPAPTVGIAGAVVVSVPAATASAQALAPVVVARRTITIAVPAAAATARAWPPTVTTVDLELRDLDITVGRVTTAWSAGPTTTAWAAGPVTT